VKTVYVCCQNEWEKAQEVVSALLGKVIFVDGCGCRLEGTALPDGDKYAMGIGEGPPIVEPWVDLSVVSAKKAAKIIRETCGCEKEPVAGLGDVIAKVTKAFGVKPCGGCKKRQAYLNKLVPIKRKKQ
jgi:hypothetical protein